MWADSLYLRPSREYWIHSELVPSRRQNFVLARRESCDLLGKSLDVKTEAYCQNMRRFGDAVAVNCCKIP